MVDGQRTRAGESSVVFHSFDASLASHSQPMRPVGHRNLLRRHRRVAPRRILFSPKPRFTLGEPWTRNDSALNTSDRFPTRFHRVPAPAAAVPRSQLVPGSSRDIYEVTRATPAKFCGRGAGVSCGRSVAVISVPSSSRCRPA